MMLLPRDYDYMPPEMQRRMDEEERKTKERIARGEGTFQKLPESAKAIEGSMKEIAKIPNGARARY